MQGDAVIDEINDGRWVFFAGRAEIELAQA